MLRIERLFFSDSEELVLTFRDELKVLTFQVFAKSDARYRGVPNTSVQ
ncbi:MAG: hypothetical protein WDA03_14440 [Trueperaceae bacterium]